jgi:predicted nucleic acid-binding protein
VTSKLIIDSCVLAKLVLVEAESVLADQRVRSAAAAGSEVLALDLAPIEVTNAIWKASQRGWLPVDKAQLALQELLAVPIRYEPTRSHLTRALDIALDHQLAVYDALFVAFVESSGGCGVTSDQKLVEKVHQQFPNVTLLV